MTSTPDARDASGVEDLVERACDTLAHYRALGNEVLDSPRALFVRNHDLPAVYDANHVSTVRTKVPSEIDDVLERAEQVFANFRHRRFYCDPPTPPDFEARLVLDGYEVDATLQLVLEGELEAAGRDVEIRLAETDEDWASLGKLHRLDHLEEAEKFDRAPYTQETTDALVASKRPKAPALRFWIAREDGVDCAFFSSLPGANGVGLVEDLFTRADFRGRGIATALIVHAVADARERGAGPVLIGSLPEDTPGKMYAAFGFRPLCVTRGYLKR